MREREGEGRAAEELGFGQISIKNKYCIHAGYMKTETGVCPLVATAALRNVSPHSNRHLEIWPATDQKTRVDKVAEENYWKH